MTHYIIYTDRHETVLRFAAKNWRILPSGRPRRLA